MSVSNNDAASRHEMLMELTAEVVAAYVSNNSIPAGEFPNLISDVHAALDDDYIICLEDGKKFKSLKRHLMTHYGLTPEQYREKWELDANYPMVAPNYAAARSLLARKIGLGRKRKAK